MNISIIGGDLRIVRLAEMYANEGNNVYTYGLERYFEKEENCEQETEKEINSELRKVKINNEKYKNIFVCNSIEETIQKSNYIFSGMPFTKNKITVNAPFANKEITLKELHNALHSNNKKGLNNALQGTYKERIINEPHNNKKEEQNKVCNTYDEGKINNKKQEENIQSINKKNRQSVEIVEEATIKKFFAGGIPQEFYNNNKKMLQSDFNNINMDKNTNSIIQKDEDTIITEPINNYRNNISVELIDLLDNEELTILNAIPTVEGTIKIAIEQREETIHESNVLICGFGRIGKILCDRFSKLGANVYCVARKESDLAWIREKRYIPLTYSELPNFASKIDIVINTVPHIILAGEELKLFNKNVLIIDVASAPGGIDKASAQKLGLKVITALGIPGKEMPKTAGRYIKQTIDKLIK